MDDLRTLVNRYHEVDSKLKSLEKIKKPLNSEIKTLMLEQNLSKFESEDAVAVYKSYEKTSINPDMLLRQLKEQGITEAIITTEVADVGKVEELISKGKLDPIILESCLKIVPVQSLTVKAKAGGKKK